MKRILTVVTAILLALVTITGCAAPAVTELTRGTIEGSVYTNESAMLTFTAPEGWTYYTDEEIAEFLGTDGISNGLFDHDMMVKSATGTLIKVMYENFPETTDPNKFNEKEYFDIIARSLRDKAQFKYELSDYTNVRIGSITFKMMKLVLTDQDYPLYYYAHRSGLYLLCVEVIITGGDDIDSIMANFS